jgi:uroporphyrinogen decarboxylase
VREETLRIMRIVGAGVGYIAAPTYYIPRDAPAENVMAMVDVFRNQDRHLA